MDPKIWTSFAEKADLDGESISDRLERLLINDLSPKRRQKRVQKVVADPISAPAGRNAQCPCGSGKKFKKCCLGKLVS